MHQFLFPLSLFLSACLLFVIQPMVAKVLLPVYGGTPAVWSVCMLFFQALLLIAYAYAWVLSRFKGTRQWRVFHLIICLLSLVFLPLALSPVPNHGMPEMLILKTLLLQMGLPLLVVGASAPLLQYAYSQTGHKKTVDPYFLYAASNAGSLMALLSYPWLVERFSKVSQQFYGWNAVYLIYLGLLGWMLLGTRYQVFSVERGSLFNISWRQKASWIFLSFVPCSLMLGVTFYITTDVAATPLFWVLPLALYLFSFVVTFANNPLISHQWVTRNILFFLIFPCLGFIIGIQNVAAWQLILVHLGSFLMLALLFHGELAHTRPSASHLTTFYFCLALGGVLAGLFNGLLAPQLFSHAYEYPLVMLLALLGIPIQNKKQDWIMPLLVLSLLLINYVLPDKIGIFWVKQYHLAEILAVSMILTWPNSVRSLFLSMTILFVFIFMPWFKATEILSQQRNFYGVKQVFSQDGAHVLMSHSTIHGFQIQSYEHSLDGARAYYAAVMPVVQLMHKKHRPLHAMVMGLGTGIMACQFREDDKLTMVEIDEQVIDMARDPHLFTYLRDCPPAVNLVKEDGRLAVGRLRDASHEILVLDAFNSDAIPVHLLTLEAFTLYQQKMTFDGVILVNISNRHLRVLPVLTAVGRELDMIVLHKRQKADYRLGQLASEWALLTRNESLAARLFSQGGWRFVADAESLLWTDDYSNLIPLLKWTHD